MKNGVFLLKRAKSSALYYAFQLKLILDGSWFNEVMEKAFFSTAHLFPFWVLLLFTCADGSGAKSTRGERANSLRYFSADIE